MVSFSTTPILGGDADESVFSAAMNVPLKVPEFTFVSVSAREKPVVSVFDLIRTLPVSAVLRDVFKSQSTTVATTESFRDTSDGLTDNAAL